MKRSLLYALVLCACGRGGSDLCQLSTKCPGDSQQPNVTPIGQSIADCKHNLKGACASKYESWASCGWDNQTCKADGTTDQDAVNAACTDAFNQYFVCCANVDGGC
jgi:hypothetical protein